MQGLITLAEQRVHARPTSEDEARAVLEWIAAREHKAFGQLLGELRQQRAAELVVPVLNVPVMGGPGLTARLLR